MGQLRLRPKHVVAHPANVFALGFGLGLSKYAPGTVGSLLGLPLFLLLQPLGIFGMLIAIAVLFGFGVWCCEVCSKNLEVHDHPGIVWDEVVGMLITLLFAPLSWLSLLLGFLLFRFFDVLKPWPIGWVDARVSGGLGIMLDDVLAGIFALAALQIILHWLVPLVS